MKGIVLAGGSGIVKPKKPVCPVFSMVPQQFRKDGRFRRKLNIP